MAGAPNLLGAYSREYADTLTGYNGVFYSAGGGYIRYQTHTTSTSSNVPGFDASRYSSIYGSSETITPLSCGTVFMIRF